MILIDSFVVVKNLNGTADNKPPKGYGSWLEWWIAQTGKKSPYCSCTDCLDPAEVGAHVKKVNSDDNRWYIVPLCKSCNGKSSDTTFTVKEADLVEVNN